MTPTSAEILETARGLPPEERAELARMLLATLGEHDLTEPTRLDSLRSAIERGCADLDAGDGLEIDPGGVDEYLRERGRLATERVDAKTP